MTDEEYRAARKERGRTVAWAEYVPKFYEPGLADLENVLLINDRFNLRRLKHKVRGRVRRVALLQFLAFFLGAPLANLPVFSSGRWWGTTREYGAWWAYPTAAIVSCIGVAALAFYYWRWSRQRVRFRNQAVLNVCVVYVVFTVPGLVAAYRLADTFDGSIGWYVAPMWIFLLLTIASVVYMVRSPANPAWDTLLSGGKRRLRADCIHEEDRAWLLEERGRAIRVLADRGLLEGGETPEELAARPLGELHLPTPTSSTA